MNPSRNKFFDSKWFVVLMGALTAFDPLTIDMYLPAFGDIQRDLGTTMSNVELSVSTFFIGMALGQLFYGPLADRFGRKRPLQFGMGLYFLATIGCAYAPTIQLFIACRLLQALGGCAGMVITRAIVRDVFDRNRVAGFFSSMALVMGLAPILAPSIGAFINHLFGWRAIFQILAASNIIAMICIARFLPETLPAGHPNRKREIPIRSVLRTYGEMLRSRSFVGYLIPDASVRAGMFAYIAGSPFVFIELLHIPKEHYGWVFGLNGLGLMAAAQVNRLLLKRWDSDQILSWSVRCAALASVFVFLGAWLSAEAVFTLVPIFFFLATLNFVGPSSLAGALATQGHQAGSASALYGCLQWSLASLASFFVSYFHNGTAFPMTGVILGCGFFSLISFQVLVGQRGRV